MTQLLHSFCLCLLSFSLLMLPVATGEGQHWIEYGGGAGPGEGKHLVFLAGDEEYRSEEGLPMLAQILSERHGFRCTVLFPIDPETGEIDPNNRESLPGSEALDSADAIVMALRFRAWPEKPMQRFIEAYHAGKPIIALRTSTHAFNFPDGSPFREYNTFGKRVLGEGWVSHWGKHKVEATRGVIEPGAEDNPILRGVTDVFGDSDVYEVYPPDDANILMRGKVLAGMSPEDPPASYTKKRASDGQEQDVNDPMMPIAWTRLFENEAGKSNRIFCTTMGAATDLQSEGLRRLIVNAVYWGLELEIPQQANVDTVGKFNPTPYGFEGFRQGVKPEDLAMAELPPSELPLRFLHRERITLVGNSLAERMNLFGHFEALLHARHPKQELMVRNFARPGDAVEARLRPTSYTTIDDPLQVFGPDTFLCFFGFNEAFAGEEGVESFREAYERYIDETLLQYPRNASGGAPRMVLISPIAWESTGNPHLPKVAEHNENLARYAEVVQQVAHSRGFAFVDLFTPTRKLFTAEPEMQYTINGCHLNEAGDRLVAILLDRQLAADSQSADMDSDEFATLRAAVVDKSWHHMQDYRMVNGWYVYGGRRTWDKETFPAEYEMIRGMVALRDQYVWELAQGRSPEPPDDSVLGELEIPPTRFGQPQMAYSEPEELRYLTPEECIETMTAAEGFEVQLFASEREFPELAKPVQINFDNRGRLWVSCMPTYPQWKPGEPRPSDRLLILEDTNGDGKADRSKVFYDKLHCPTGFEFWNGGVLVVDQPRLIWLKDTTGDDRADVVVHLFDGWATDDTHHAVGAFEFSHAGLLHMLEGIAMTTTVETPWGPVRERNSSGAYVLDPRTLRLRHFLTPGHANPWCYVFDSWGQGIVGDGTTAQHHWDSPFKGAKVPDRSGIDPIFDNQGMRPAAGCEFLVSRHFPDEVQGQLTYSCVVNMNGFPRFTVHDESSGFAGSRVMRQQVDERGSVEEVPDDLIASTDKTFRPVDPQIGPDGALWFGDWCNALIGHMQYSQRDPNRDREHGRIYRLVYPSRPLVKPVTQHGKSELELLEQFREYEPRTRGRVRRELRDRPPVAVLAAIDQWLERLNPQDPEFDRLRCEALWLQQSFHAVDQELLRKVLASKAPEARAAATHILADERDTLPDALELLQAQVKDDHPRVRLEAVRGLSFFSELAAAEAALAVLDAPLDRALEYTLQHTLSALEPAWSDAYEQETLAASNPAATEFLQQYVATRKPGLAARGHLTVVLDPDKPAYQRDASYHVLEQLTGNADNGKAVFRRVCASCHIAEDVGHEFGPELSDAGKRLSRHDIIESIIEPNKKVDEKYITTSLVTFEGKTEQGFVVEENDEGITLLMAEGKQQFFPHDDIDDMYQSSQSSMPENLASTISPTEFLDVVEYLTTLKPTESE